MTACRIQGAWHDNMVTLPGDISAVALRQAIAALLLPVGLLLSIACGTAQAAAGETLAQVKSRGTLRCGVGEDSVGFASKDAAGRWLGLDVDFCRAVAAAALGDASKVTFIPLRASERFPALQARTIDLLVRQTTWTLLREGNLKVLFAGVLFYDSQGFLVPAGSGIKTSAQLKGATVCVVKGTTSGQNLADYSVANGLNIEALVSESMSGSFEALVAGRCRALTSDASQLVAVRLRSPGGPRAYLILLERISKEPLGPVVRSGDDDWFTLVRWVLFALVSAEEAGLTRDNVSERASDPRGQEILGRGEQFSQALGVGDDWMLRVVQSVGNYGEIYERNLGRDSPLKIERGLNKPWTQGGLMYAPPFR
jgi:general L-amino acid transport system substrate-binding protein